MYDNSTKNYYHFKKLKIRTRKGKITSTEMFYNSTTSYFQSFCFRGLQICLQAESKSSTEALDKVEALTSLPKLSR